MPYITASLTIVNLDTAGFIDGRISEKCIECGRHPVVSKTGASICACGVRPEDDTEEIEPRRPVIQTLYGSSEYYKLLSSGYRLSMSDTGDRDGTCTVILQ